MMEDQEKWRADLKSSDMGVRAAAAENLCLAGADSVGAAVDLVSSCGDDESVHRWAVAALEELGPPRLDALESLTVVVTSPNSLVAYWAATLLGRLGPAAATSQNVLAGVLSNSDDTSVKERAAWALGKMGATSDVAVAALNNTSTLGNARLARLVNSALPRPQESICENEQSESPSQRLDELKH